MTEYERLHNLLKDEEFPVHITTNNGENGVIYYFDDPVNGKYYQQIVLQANGTKRIITNYASGKNEEYIHDGKSVRKVF